MILDFFGWPFRFSLVATIATTKARPCSSHCFRASFFRRSVSKHMGTANPIFFPRPLTHQKYFFFENSTSTDPSTTQDSRLNLIYSTLKNLKTKSKNNLRQQIGQKSTFWRIMEKHNFSNPRQQIDQHELVFSFKNHSLPSFYSVFSEIEQKLFKFFFPQTATLAHLAKPSPSTLSAMAPVFLPLASLKTTVEKNSSFPRTRPDLEINLNFFGHRLAY